MFSSRSARRIRCILQREIPELVSSRFKPVVVVNTREVDNLPFGLFLEGRAERVLPALVETAWPG